MPKTAVINRRKKRRSSRRRRNAPRRTSYGAAARTENARRRRRRSTRRRRNPTGPVEVREAYRSSGYRRKPNPNGGSLFDFNALTQITPAATAGVLLARWATHLAGEFEDDEPDIKHAVAIWIAAGLGGQIVGQILNDRYKGLYAHIAALGFGGDLFLRKVFLKETDWFQENLYLGENNEEETDYTELDGFQDTSTLGQTYYDAQGNAWVLTAQGYQPAGRLMGQPPMLPEDPAVGVGTQLAGFQDTSALGRRMVRAGGDNSFGYSG